MTRCLPARVAKFGNDLNPLTMRNTFIFTSVIGVVTSTRPFKVSTFLIITYQGTANNNVGYTIMFTESQVSLNCMDRSDFDSYLLTTVAHTFHAAAKSSHTSNPCSNLTMSCFLDTQCKGTCRSELTSHISINTNTPISMPKLESYQLQCDILATLLHPLQQQIV